jgi:hypothetical protein
MKKSIPTTRSSDVGSRSALFVYRRESFDKTDVGSINTVIEQLDAAYYVIFSSDFAPPGV